MIRFVCQCGRQLQARDEDIGKKARCPSCDRIMTVPEEEPLPRREDLQREPRSSNSLRSSREQYRDREDDRYYDDDIDGDEAYERDRPRRRRREISQPDKGSGKATTAMILGLISLCLPVLPAIPALILGLLALRDIGQSEGKLGGRGLALTGIICGCISFFLAAPLVVALAVLMPAVSKVRDAAARSQDANHLKEIGMAFHNFANVRMRLPRAAAFKTKSGAPGLSWRVALLPFLNEEGLYRQFRLDEPWDSPANKALLTRMPKVYLQSGKPNEGLTCYQVFVGNRTIFEPKPEPPDLGGSELLLGLPFPVGITDGTSNTILVATARNPVPWTKPDDLPFDPNGILPPLGEQFSSSFSVLMADGSVRSLPSNIPEPTLKAMITCNGGEIVPWP